MMIKAETKYKAYLPWNTGSCDLLTVPHRRRTDVKKKTLVRGMSWRGPWELFRW